MDVDFDALFSSSPLAQSTPRIRLEPTFEEDGSSHLRNVPADTRSLFDPESSLYQADEMDIDLPPPRQTSSRRLIDAVRRTNSQLKQSASLMVRPSSARRTKKHPSPSKAELESLEIALRNYSPPENNRFDESDEVLATCFQDLRTERALATRNGRSLVMKSNNQRKTTSTGLDIFEKLPASVASARMAEVPKRSAFRSSKSSMIPKAAGSPHLKPPTKGMESKLHDDSSAMDIDELQWDKSMYHI
jgi:hypothetical protein